MTTLLIADDNEQNRYLLQALLTGHGYNVILAADGAEALGKALENPPDMIIADILMPGMDGYSLCREWKSNDRLKELPFVFYTATYTDPKDEEFALSLGAECFMVKPQEPDAFLQTIGNVMEQSRKGCFAPARQPVLPETTYFKKYNEALIRKLEDKLEELETANAALEGEIAVRRQTEEVLRKSEERHSTILKAALDGFIVMDPDGNLLEVNEAYCRMTGYTEQELLSMRAADLVAFETEDALTGRLRKIMTLGEHRFESRHRRKDGTIIDVEVGSQYRPGDGGRFVVFLHDITEKRRSEEAKAKLEEQLRHAQKMESVGRLAGGLAHDFNNMLSVIIGYTEVVMGQLPPDSPLRADLGEAFNAATRSADLTRQLLAFARKQIIAPKVLDLNETVASLVKMLQRLIGESVQLKWHPGTGLWQVRMDPSQIDQILANLSVNARDAIADVGLITISTENRTVDEYYSAGYTDFAPGDYVLLTVSDNGCGMDKEIQSHVFEPFYTTKEIGKGTGLGLATVYGIVRQNGGFINVYSEPACGTAFYIYIPRHAGVSAQAPVQNNVPAPFARGNETILLVEDEPAFLRLATTMLQHQGYTVLAAGTPGEALRLAGLHGGQIDLLMTDVIMPEMNGRNLAKNLTAANPRLKCLFMSGFSPDVIARQAELQETTHFLQKPFLMKDLVAKVREVMDGH